MALAHTEEHFPDLPKESTRNSDHSAFEVAEAADNQVSPGRTGKPEEAQQQGETSSAGDVSVDDDQGRRPSAHYNSGSEVGREHDETNHEDLLNIDIGDILRTIHGSIRIAVTELLAKAADDQAAYFNLKPTKDLETLYKTAFGKNWQTDMTLMATRSQLTVADSVRSLIWAFIVGEYFGGGITLPDTFQSLCERDGIVRRWVTPLLVERGLDFNEICGRAMITQFQDPDFTKSIIQPAIYQLANQVCMILNGHIGLLHESFVHNHWRAKFMPSLRNILEWVLKLQVKMYADPRKHSFAMYNYGKPFSSDWMTAESGWEGDIVGITTMPGICRQGIDAKEVVVKAEVRLMTASLEEDGRD
ncbi:hypothetical protein HII31_05769 [Pseudocercospora fuligena]|uniref:Uncharacterized protein n=1 Tax=Pseudocercospora fuligena TaxID=685502 RepID=A0A8H6VLV6_9PEZI|nr:hypothetical protein HII31_05769 [Pseudocercospora fuligena]